MIEGSRGESSPRIKEIFVGLPLRLSHYELIYAIAKSAEAYGATHLLHEAEVRWGKGRGGGGRLDLSFRLSGFIIGVEVDNKTLKWRSLEKIRSSGVEVGVYVLRHAEPRVDRSLFRLSVTPRAKPLREWIVTRTMVEQVYPVL